jgi:Tfp pilus assembly protein PilN
MRAVNLLPRELDQGRNRPGKTVIGGCAGAVLATALIAGGYLQASSKVGHEKSALAQVQAQIAALPPLATQPATVSSLPNERSQRLAALSSALATRVSWDRVLRELSLVLPDDVWLTSLQATAPQPGAAAPTTSVTGFRVVGFTYSQNAVARLLARLAVVPDLQDVTLNSSAASKIDTRAVVTFSISANVRPPGAAS